MAIDYANLALNPELVAEYLAQYLNDSGIFDNVTFDVVTNTITGYSDGTEIFRVSPNATLFSIYWRGTAVREWYNLTTMSVGKTSKGVVLSIVPSNVADMYYTIICKSKGGIPMLIFRNLPAEGSYCVTADYSSTPVASAYVAPPYRVSQDFMTGYPNADYSAGVPICTTATGTETVAVADGVEFLLARQTNIPTNLITEITVGGSPALAIGVQLILLD